MANVLAVKQRRTYKMVNGKKVATPKPSAANLAHAAAVTKASYWLNDGSGILKSSDFENVAEVNAKWKQWEAEASERYRQHHKAHRKPPKNTTLIEEMMLIIGTDVKCEDAAQLIEAYCKHFEEKYNTRVLYWAYHNHEGHIDEEGGEKINRHVHIFFDNIDKNGKSVRRQWGRTELSRMQTDAYEVGKSVGLDIERATKYKEGEAPKGQGHRGYREKKRKEAEAARIAKLKDIQAENKRLREQLKEAGASRDQYAELEAEIRTLKDAARSKELTIEQLQQRIAELEKIAYTTTKKKVKSKLFKKTVIKEVKQSWKDVAEQQQEQIEGLQIEVQQLKSSESSAKTKLSVQDAEIAVLKYKKEKLEREKQSKPIENTSYAQKDIQIANLTSEKILLERENAKLKKENSTLQKENSTLQKQLEKVSKKLASWRKFIFEKFKLDLLKDTPPPKEKAEAETEFVQPEIKSDMEAQSVPEKQTYDDEMSL